MLNRLMADQNNLGPATATTTVRGIKECGAGLETYGYTDTLQEHTRNELMNSMASTSITGLTNFYSGEGAVEDSQGGRRLKANRIEYAPGRLGQTFIC